MDAGIPLSRRSPLAGFSTATERVAAYEEPFLRPFAVRAAPLPDRPHQVTGTADAAVLWLGPDEWLVVSSGPQAADLVAGLDAGSVVDVSAQRTAVRLRGESAGDILAQGCPLDLHPRAFAPGQATPTALGRTQVVLWQLSAEPDYRILVRASYTRYLADWLLDAIHH